MNRRHIFLYLKRIVATASIRANVEVVFVLGVFTSIFLQYSDCFVTLHDSDLLQNLYISTVYMCGALVVYCTDEAYIGRNSVGVCLYIEEANFAFPQTLYQSECHQRWIPRGSDTFACPHLWLTSVGVQCQALEARKNLVGRIEEKGTIWKGEMG